MREILFRGKMPVESKWAYGSLISEANVFDKRLVLTHIYDKDCNEILVDPKTVGQYTGLCDRNGRKIFEGDIVTVFYNPNYIGVSKDRVGNFIVVFHDACFMKRKITKPMSDDAGLYHFIQSDEFKVIGNIYDNPELLGGEKNG